MLTKRSTQEIVWDYHFLVELHRYDTPDTKHAHSKKAPQAARPGAHFLGDSELATEDTEVNLRHYM